MHRSDTDAIPDAYGNAIGISDASRHTDAQRDATCDADTDSWRNSDA
jgi:hypothetical protein